MRVCSGFLLASAIALFAATASIGRTADNTLTAHTARQACRFLLTQAWLHWQSQIFLSLPIIL